MAAGKGGEGGRRGEGDVGRGRAVSLILCNRVGNSTSSYERAEREFQIDVAVDFFYGGRDSYLVRRAECEFGVQRCRIGSQQANRTIVLQYVVYL